MQHSFRVIDGAPAATLPVLATADDVREVVQLLRKRPEGITIIEASEAVRKRLFDPRKVAAYESWGIVSNNGDRMRLTKLGLEFARKLEPEALIYRAMLDNMPPYRAVLEWIQEHELELVTYADIGEYWRENFPTALLQDEKTCEGHVVCFLHLCHAAEIGMATVGRKGQPSRLRVDREELATYVQNNSEISSPAVPQEHRADPQRLVHIGPASRQERRIFISAIKGLGIVDSIRDALQIADIDYEIVERNSTAGEWIANRIYEAMRRCNAGIIIVTSAETSRGSLNQTALIEIGAAMVHFERRLVLLFEHTVPTPFAATDFCQLEFEGDRLTWETGIRLVKTLKSF